MAFDYTGIPPGDAMKLRLISKRVKELLPTVIPIISWSIEIDAACGKIAFVHFP